eukprot:COSAG01_NODE_19321_length_1017_cov_3.273420_1_plen_84_part_00
MPTCQHRTAAGAAERRSSWHDGSWMLPEQLMPVQLMPVQLAGMMALRPEMLPSRRPPLPHIGSILYGGRQWQAAALCTQLYQI